MTPTDVQRLLKLAEAIFGVPPKAVLSKGRSRYMVEARHAVELIMRNESLSYPRIAELLKLGHHTTAVHGAHNAQSLIETNRAFRIKWLALEKAWKRTKATESDRQRLARLD